MNNKIGENIKSIRKASGLTQNDVAERLYTTPQNISRVESGEGDPTVEMLMGLSRLFGVSLDMLVGKESLSENELMNQIRIYFRDTTDDNISNAVFLLCKNILLGRFLKVCGEFDEKTETYTSFLRKNLTSVFSDKADRPRIFVSVETSTVNIGGISAEKLNAVFRALSDPAVIQFINQISSDSENGVKAYDKESFCMKFNISEANLDNLIPSLQTLELLSVKTVALNNTNITVYRPHLNKNIVLLLSVSDLLYNETTDGNIH